MYKLQKGDLFKASTILGEAFSNYPIFEYIIPNSAYRRKHLKYLCHFLLRLGISKGEVIAPNDTLEGVSIWLPSTGTKNSGIDAIEQVYSIYFFTSIEKQLAGLLKLEILKKHREPQL